MSGLNIVPRCATGATMICSASLSTSVACWRKPPPRKEVSGCAVIRTCREFKEIQWSGSSTDPWLRHLTSSPGNPPKRWSGHHASLTRNGGIWMDLVRGIAKHQWILNVISIGMRLIPSCCMATLRMSPLPASWCQVSTSLDKMDWT